jgi:hypothetical protein
MEAFAVQPRFVNLFSVEQLATARRWLEDEDFDIDAHMAAPPPRDWGYLVDCARRRN